MTPKYRFLLFFFCIFATTIAIPLPDVESEKSLGQHLGQVGLWFLGGLAMIGLSIGSVTHGTNWWHRFKTIQAEHEGNMTMWDTTQARKEQEHQKLMKALDIILDVTRNYTDSVGKERTEHDPFVMPKDIEVEVQDAQTTEDKQH